MSSWGTRRQVSFILVFILILGAIITALIISHQEDPTCFDGIQNQGELEIDCGGECLKVCSIETTDLIVHWSRVFRVRDGKYDLAILVENPNQFGLSDIPFFAKVHDERNILVKEIRGSTYLNPGEKALIFEPNINVGQRTPINAFVEMGDNPEWRRLESVRKPILTVGGKQVRNETNGEVRITLTNDSLFPAEDIEVYALVADDVGNVFAVSGTEVAELKVGEEREIIFTWPELFPKDPFAVEIMVRTNLVHGHELVEGAFQPERQ